MRINISKRYKDEADMKYQLTQAADGFCYTGQTIFEHNHIRVPCSSLREQIIHDLRSEGLNGHVRREMVEELLLVVIGGRGKSCVAFPNMSNCCGEIAKYKFLLVFTVPVTTLED